MSGVRAMLPAQRRDLAYACGVLAMGLMAVDFFNPSLPAITAGLHTSQTATKTLIAVYMLTLGLVQPLYGSCSDRHGRRPALLVGLTIAVGGLALSGASTSITMLYLGRAFTACGTAACTVVSRAIISDVFDGASALRGAFAWFTMASQLSPALAPVIGAAIGQQWGWRACFFTLAAATALHLAVLTRTLHETHPPAARLHSAAAGSARAAYAALLRDPKFMAHSVGSALIMSFTLGFYAMSPYAFHALGFAPIENALFYLLYASAILTGSALAMRLPVHRASESIYAACIASFAALCGLAWLVGIGRNLPAMAAFAMALGTLCGVAAPLALALGMTHAVPHGRGAASALQGAIKMGCAGLFMLGFDLVHIRDFDALVTVFGGISLLLAASLFRSLAATRPGKGPGRSPADGQHRA